MENLFLVDVGRSSGQGEQNHFPKHKVVGPSTVIEYLVIILNTERNGGPFAT
jgi:hypothetical protein